MADYSKSQVVLWDELEDELLLVIQHCFVADVDFFSLFSV